VEEEVARLTAELAALTEANAVGNTIAAETFYYLTIPLMILIHVGFLAYEMGASRQKNVLASGIKNILAFAFLVPTFYYAGWFIYWAFPTGIDMSVGAFEISGWDYAMAAANPIGEVMGPSLADNATGVFWGAFTFFALGVLINLGPRIGKYNRDGSANHIAGHSMPMTLVGLMTIIVGFWGFLMACAIYPGEGWSWSATEFTSIYGTPMTLSAMTFNILMGFAGGIIGAWLTTRDPFWMMSGALGGIIACAAGLDLWWPPMAFAIGFVGACIMPISAKFLEKIGIDDAVGAVTVHGTVGAWGVIAVGIFASGYPAYQGDAGAVALTSITGQAIGLGVMFLLGFVPGYLLSLLFRIFGMLRVPEAAELAGLDATKVPAIAYPEGMNGNCTRKTRLQTC